MVHEDPGQERFLGSGTTLLEVSYCQPVRSVCLAPKHFIKVLEVLGLKKKKKGKERRNFDELLELEHTVVC